MKQLKVRRRNRFLPKLIFLGLVVFIGCISLAIWQFKGKPTWQTYKLEGLVFSYPPGWITAKTNNDVNSVTIYDRLDDGVDGFSIQVKVIEPYSSLKNGEPASLLSVPLSKYHGVAPVSFNGYTDYLKFYGVDPKPDRLGHAFLSTTMVKNIQAPFTPSNHGIVIIDGGYALDEFDGSGKSFTSVEKAMADPNYQLFKQIIESMHF
jgi:hypothetical protein